MLIDTDYILIVLILSTCVGVKTEPTLDHPAYLPINRIYDAGQTTRKNEGSAGAQLLRSKVRPHASMMKTLEERRSAPQDHADQRRYLQARHLVLISDEGPLVLYFYHGSVSAEDKIFDFFGRRVKIA